MNKIKVQVIKRGGRLEVFDKAKLYKVAKATGLNHKEATKLVSNLESWVRKNQKENKIHSLTIRKRFYLELLKVDEYSASLYAWYQKLKDKTYHSTFLHTK